MPSGNVEPSRTRHCADNRKAAIIARRLLENDVRAAIRKHVKIADGPLRTVHPEAFNVRCKFRRRRKFLVLRLDDRRSNDSSRGLKSRRSCGAHRNCPKGPPKTPPGTISSDRARRKPKYD